MKAIWNAKCNVLESLFEYLSLLFQQNNFISIDAEDMLKNPDQSILSIENGQLVFILLKLTTYVFGLWV